MRTARREWYPRRRQGQRRLFHRCAFGPTPDSVCETFEEKSAICSISGLVATIATRDHPGTMISQSPDTFCGKFPTGTVNLGDTKVTCGAEQAGPGRGCAMRRGAHMGHLASRIAATVRSLRLVSHQHSGGECLSRENYSRIIENCGGEPRAWTNPSFSTS